MGKSKASRQGEEKPLMDQFAIPILLTSLGYSSEAAKRVRLVRVSADEWHTVVELSQQHSITSLLYHRLKSLNLSLPGDISQELELEYLKQAQRNIRLYHELGKLLRLLQEKNIAVIVLKGAYLAEAVYDNIGLRRMSDVDLLVKKNDLQRVEQELFALGFMPEDRNRVIAQINYHFAYRQPGNGLRLEIHWAIVPSSSLFQIDVDGLWSRSQPVILAQAGAQALSPEDLLLHLCQHTAKHSYDMQLRMLCDIGEVVRCYGAQLDWQEISARSRQWGVLRAVYVILRLARELLDAAVPAEWLASIRPDDFDELYLDLVREQIVDNRAAGNMQQTFGVTRMWAAKGLGRKLALARDRLFPAREAMALKYPAPANSWRIYLYYPARILYVLLRHGATLWGLVRGDPKTRTAAEHTNEVTALREWLMSG